MKYASYFLYLVIFLFTVGCAPMVVLSTSADQQKFARSLVAQIQSIKDSMGVANAPITPIKRGGCTDVPNSRDDLSSLRTVVKIISGEQNAGVSVPGFGGLTLGRKETSYSLYYIEPKVVACENNTEKVYGIGYSIHFWVKKVNRKIDVTKLPSLAASMQLESSKTQVQYSMQTYGLSGTVLVKYFRPVIDQPFDVDGFGTMQSKIDGIHGILSDSTLSKTIKISPMELKFVSAIDLNL